MIRAGWQIRIERPQQRVFDFVADPANSSIWSTDAASIELTTASSKPPEELSFVARRPGAVARIHFRFAKAGEAATHVSCDAEIELKGALRLAEPALAGIMRRGVQTSRGPALKAALER